MSGEKLKGRHLFITFDLGGALPGVKGMKEIDFWGALCSSAYSLAKEGKCSVGEKKINSKG